MKINENQLDVQKSALLKEVNDGATSYTVEALNGNYTTCKIVANSIPTFKDTHYPELAEKLNNIISKTFVSRYENTLFYMSLSITDDSQIDHVWFSYRNIVHNIFGRIESDTDYITNITLENAKEVINYIAEYSINNPILYVMNYLNFEYEDTDYIKMLINKAMTDYEELKLIIQASSI